MQNISNNIVRIFIMFIGLGLGNAIFFFFMNSDCYELKSVGHYIGFSLISMGCNGGYFFAASHLSDRFPKTSIVLLLPAFTVIPSMMRTWSPAGSYAAFLLAVLTLIFVFRKRIFYELGSLASKK